MAVNGSIKSASFVPTKSYALAWLAPLCFGFTLLFQALFTYFVVDPKVGFDDANITQVYARHFAEGHGFVYNIGGERVEGSTSLLWTIINAAMFLTPVPILLITALSFGLTAGTLALSGRIARGLGGSRSAEATVYLLFNLFPGLFLWSLWALMDITLWVFAITAMIWALVQAARADSPSFASRWTLMLCAVALPVVRPEGIAFVLAVAAFVFMVRTSIHQGALLAGKVATLGVASILAATLWRISYFGYPVPNTFYAKTSTDLVGQIAGGARYLAGYFAEPATAILLLGLALGVLTLRGSEEKVQRVYAVLVPYLAIGAFAVYVVLGGDHFRHHRFFLFLIPLSLPVFAHFLVETWRRAPDRFGRSVVAGTLLLYSAMGWAIFHEERESVRNELRIAVINRQIGTDLAALPNPPSLAIIAAGGIKMTYPGLVLDVLGLNWVEMAHKRSVRADVLKNHGGFDAGIFLKAKPGIVFPRLGDCDDGLGYVEDPFAQSITREITKTPVFRKDYVPMCKPGVVLYAARGLLETLQASGFEPYPMP
jgi:hypothetical protein